MPNDVPYELVFDSCLPAEVKVSIAGEAYTLKEATEEAVRRYKNLIQTYVNKPPEDSTKGMYDVESVMVANCLYDASGQPVGLGIIRSWRSTLVQKLFREIEKMSELNEEETLKDLESQKEAIQQRIDKLKAEDIPAKNEPSATPTTTG